MENITGKNVSACFETFPESEHINSTDNVHDKAFYIQYFKEHNIRLKILDIPTTLIDPPEGQEWIFDMVLNILIEVMSSIAEQERVTIRERQRQGIEALKHTSAWENYGRPNLKIPENYPEVMRRWTSGEITAVAAMNLTGIKRTTFYRLAAKYKKGELKL